MNHFLFRASDANMLAYSYQWWWGPWWPLIGFGIATLALWSLFWKGLALWHSGRRGQYWWFVVILILNTAGILEIIYLFGIAKLHFDELFTSKKEDRGLTNTG